MLKDYGVSQNDLPSSMTLCCDNLSAINIFKNPVRHSQTKHIDIRHHFIISLVEDKVIKFKHIHIERQIADICTKGLDAFRFKTLRSSLELCAI